MISEAVLTSANIFSVFCSIQGEGIYVGAPQIFIRATGCNLRCDYCDTTEALVPQAIARIEQTPFAGNAKLVSNPLSVESVTTSVQHLLDSFAGFHSISLTGGEPLLHYRFLKELLPGLKQTGLSLFLETNGTLPEPLAKVIDLIDIVSMDVKIPSSIASGRVDWGTTGEFLRIAAQRSCYVKVIVPESAAENQNGVSAGPNSSPGRFLEEEFITAGEMVAKVAPQVPVVIQPVFKNNRPDRNYTMPSFKQMLKIYQLFRARLKDVRIIPQVHKLMKWS